MKKANLLLLITMLIYLNNISISFAQPIEHKLDAFTNNIHWKNFISQHNLVWEEIPLQWNEAAFIGNGHTGIMIYVSLKDNAITFHLGRSDVTDHRKAPTQKTSFNIPNANVYYDFCRLEIGKMQLKPVGKILSGKIYQDIWNAEVKGNIKTTAGNIIFTAFVPRNRNVQIVSVESSEKSDAKNEIYHWNFLPGNPSSPRALIFPNRDESKAYVSNPNPIKKVLKKFNICTQTLLAGGDYATVWREVHTREKRSSTVYISIANEVPLKNKSVDVAINSINNAKNQGLYTIKRNHQNWWHKFYKQSFLSIPDPRVESFYWIQLYKMASASAPDGPTVDCFGPFYKTSQWPGIWWNLNIQLTYLPIYTSNHLELGENMIALIDNSFETLLSRFCGAGIGDLCWTMNNYWKHYAYTGNWKIIEQKWIPKALHILECYQKGMFVDSTGRIQLGLMESPEYKGFTRYQNTNYNLANLRWLLNTLIEISSRQSIYSDEIPKWKAILSKLIPYPIDHNGLMIGSNQPLDISHRHYSHLLALYPLFQLNPELKEDSLLALKSIVHWHKIESGKALAGYSYTGAASLYAALKRGDDALANIKQFLTGTTGKSKFHRNTFYTESNGKNPVIETPLSGATSILELLLQSWGNKISVFPAIPKEWGNASFKDLRAEGGYLISAMMKNKRINWIQIVSKTGQPFTLKANNISQLKIKKAPSNTKISIVSNDEIMISLKAGNSIFLVENLKEKQVLDKVEHLEKIPHPFGVKKGEQILENQDWQVRDFLY